MVPAYIFTWMKYQKHRIIGTQHAISPIYVLTEEYPDVYLEKKTGVWKYSRSSLDAIDEIHDQVYPFGTDALLTLLPKLGTKKILGLYLYQYIGILILSLICVIIHKVFSYFFEQILTRMLLKFGYAKLADRFLLPVARPISIFCNHLIATGVFTCFTAKSRYLTLGDAGAQSTIASCWDHGILQDCGCPGYVS